MVSDDHEGVKGAVASELPGLEWQRCAVRFQGNVLAHVPTSSMGEVAQRDLKAVFEVRRKKSALALLEEFAQLYRERFPKAVSVFEVGIGDALATCCATPALTTRGGSARGTCQQSACSRR